MHSIGARLKPFTVSRQRALSKPVCSHNNLFRMQPFCRFSCPCVCETASHHENKLAVVIVWGCNQTMMTPRDQKQDSGRGGIIWTAFSFRSFLATLTIVQRRFQKSNPCFAPFGYVLAVTIRRYMVLCKGDDGGEFWRNHSPLRLVPAVHCSSRGSGLKEGSLDLEGVYLWK